MRKFIRASVLVLVLAAPVFAGEIPYGVTGGTPNGATAVGDIQCGADGEMQNGLRGEIPYGVTSQPTLVELLLSLLSLV